MLVLLALIALVQLVWYDLFYAQSVFPSERVVLAVPFVIHIVRSHVSSDLCLLV